MKPKYKGIAEPDYDFTIKEATQEEVLGKSFFTSESSIIKCIEGHAKILINSSVHSFEKGSNFFLGDAMYFKVSECSDDFKMVSAIFSVQFFNEIYPSLENKVVNVIFNSAPDLYDQNETQVTNLTIEKLILLNKNIESTYRHKIAINLVLCYLYEIYDITYKKVVSNVENTANYTNMLLDKFCALCKEYHATYRNVDFYAEKLNISSRYLHTISKKALQSTPKQMIDYYTVGTAKRLLLTTTLNNQQIADELNFVDQATFGQFFKRNVGMPPSEFRNRYK